MKKYCRNCYYPLPYKAKFCAHCGQKDSDGKVPVSDVLQQLWFRVLHLESRSWRVLWRLFVPGQVSLDYFRGKRKRYPPPLQFFFVIMFFFLLVANHLIGDSGRISFRESDKALHVSSNDTMVQAADLYLLGQYHAQNQRLRNTVDSLPAEFRTPVVKAALDTLLKITGNGKEEQLRAIFDQDPGSAGQLDSLTLSLGFRQIRIATTDLFEKDADAIIRQYRLEGWLDHIIVRQGIKSVKEPKTLMKTYLGSLGWAILVLVALMAGVLTLFYRRSKRYYVEHFIFLLHQHTGNFLELTAAMIVHQFYPLPLTFWITLFLWLGISLLIAMRRYYRQGWLKTTLKWVFFSATYLLGFIVLFISSVLLVFLIF